MPQNLFRAASSSRENRIFKDESALSPEFLPEELPGREREISELVYCLSPAAENRQPEHALLYGPPGTGKTSAAKFVLKQLSEYSQRPLPIYINCWESQSRYAVLSILVSAVGEMMPRRGIAADEMFSRFVEIAKKDGKTPIVVLDEVDRLASSEGGEQILYDLCRAGENHSLHTGVIAITNDEEFHTRLDSRIRSSFVQHALKFAPYSVPQLKEILLHRAKLAFFDSALDSEAIPLCAAIAFKHNGDARVALALLLSAGKAAERADAAKVQVSHVRQVEGATLEAWGIKAVRKLPEMDELDQRIVSAVKKAGKAGIETGELYVSLRQLAGERTVRQRLEKLEKSGIVDSVPLDLGAGRTRLVKLKG
jgi:cell division control protein 6